jgi:hypothetical protein
MDDDYDNYVPQISTLQQDWQNSSGTGLDGPGGGGGQGGPGNAFLFEGMGQSAGSGGQFQQQRPFPGMGMSGGQQPQSAGAFAGADYGAGGIQVSELFALESNQFYRIEFIYIRMLFSPLNWERTKVLYRKYVQNIDEFDIK